MVGAMTTAVLDRLYRVPGSQLVGRLNAGLPAAIFPALAARLDLPAKVLAAALGLSERTLRNRKRRLTADEAERSFRAFRVFKRATAVLGDEDEARAWISTPQRALGERKPLDLLVRDVGAEEVLNVLAAIDDGGYL